jgi:hypothetical protein
MPEKLLRSIIVIFVEDDHFFVRIALRQKTFNGSFEKSRLFPGDANAGNE